MYPTATDTAAPLAYRPQKSSLAELFEVILDRGLVIDAFVRVSLIGIELVTIDARVVVASVDTYLHFAEAVNRLDLRAESEAWNLTDLGDLGDVRGELADEATDEAMDSLTGRIKDAIPFVSSGEKGSEPSDEGES